MDGGGCLVSTMTIDETVQLGWTALDVAELTQGTWYNAPENADWRATGICVQPEQFQSGYLLAAPSGPAGLRDGNVKSLASKSQGIIAENAEAYLAYGVPVLEVPSLRNAITDLARGARKNFKGTVIAVTGSVGKTTTVAMVEYAVAGFSTSDRSRTSANSLYGIGWNLASMRRDVTHWVQEMAVGKMDVCTRLVEPDVAIVTAIAPAHLASFGDTDNIAKMKARIYQGMKPGAVAVINFNMPEHGIFVELAEASSLKIVGFGYGEDCYARLLRYENGVVDALIDQKEYRFVLGVPGEHMAMNALGVLAAIAATGGDVQRAAQQFGTFTALSGRGERTKAIYNGKHIDVWDETYNANPGSMRAALKVMQDDVAVPVTSRLLIVGDMLELGPDEAAMHMSIVPDVLATKAERILFCGSLMKSVADAVLDETSGDWFEDVHALEKAIPLWVRDGDVVLLKASHGVHLSRIVRLLTKTKAPV